MHVQEVRCLRYVTSFVGVMWMLSYRSVPLLAMKKYRQVSISEEARARFRT